MTESGPAPRTDVAVDHAVVGSSDLQAGADFYGGLGFTVLDWRKVDAIASATLYGIEGGTEEVVLGVPGATTGTLRLVKTPHAAVDRGDFFRGGHALDLYTTDMPASVLTAERFGAKVGPVADYPFGPVQLTQSQAMAPDDVPVVFVGINHRLPSILDRRPDRLHSELHSVVASVDDLDAETAFWTESVGLQLKSQFPIDVEAVSEFMMLPRHAPVRMSVMTGAVPNPPRFELLAYDDAEGRLTPSRPLLPGALIPVFTTTGLEAVASRAADGGALLGTTVAAPGIDGGEDRAIGGTTPGGVDFELREPIA